MRTRLVRLLSWPIKQVSGKKAEIPFELYEDDIFLCSYPRSGSTWLRYLLAFYREPSIEWDLEIIERIVPDLHKTKVIQNVPRPRIIKSHLLYDSRYPKVVYLVRDGRDVCVSYHDVYKKIHGYQGSFDDFVVDLCRGKIWPSSWHEHVISWLNCRDNLHMHVVRYEDLLREPVDVLLGIVNFIGLPVSVDRAKWAVGKVSLEKIWGDHERMGPHRYLGFRGGVSGGAGKWRELFSDRTEAIFLKFAHEALELCGYLSDGPAKTS